MDAIVAPLGNLQAAIVENGVGGEDPDLVVILCHGFGAPGTDLVPIGGELFHRSPKLSRSAWFVFPAGPYVLRDPSQPDPEPGMEGRAWWPLDVERMQAAMLSGEPMDRRRERPEGLVEAREQLEGLIAALREATGLPMSRIVLGGFSQGAMLATEATLHAEEPPAALVLLSGTLLCEPEWTARAPARAGLRVLQSHGRQDPLLPFGESEALRDLLTGAGLAVDFVPFDGEHEIPLPVIERLADLVDGLLLA